MSNKKGSISIAVMVVGTLFLFAAVLFILYTDSSRVSGDFNDVFWYGRVYANETSLENSLYFILLESFLDSYQLVLKENSEKIGKENINLNEKFREKITGMKIEDVGGGVLFTFEDKVTPTDKATGGLLKNNFIVYGFNGLSAGVIINNWKANTTRTGSDGRVLLKVNYSSKLNANVSFAQLGLLSFNDIVNIYCGCLGSSSSDIAKTCFENKFPGFDVSFENIYSQGSSVIPSETPTTYVSGDMGSNVNVVSSVSGFAKPVNILVKLNSKDKYYINKKMKKIEFNLIFNYYEEGKSPANLAFCPSALPSLIITS